METGASSSHFLPPINSLSLILLHFIILSSRCTISCRRFILPLSPLRCPFYLQFYFPGSFSYLPFPSVVKFSLPITTTLPLFAPSVFCPQGVLSQSEANLPNYKPHLLFLSLSLSSFLVHLHSFTDTRERKQEKHLSSPNTYPLSFSFCHTVKSQLCTLPPFSPPFLPFSLRSCHCHTDLERTTTKRRERRRRGEDRRWAENREEKQEQEGKGDDEEAEEIGKIVWREEKDSVNCQAGISAVLTVCWEEHWLDDNDADYWTAALLTYWN